MKRPAWKQAAKFWKWKWDNRHSPLADWPQFRLKQALRKEILQTGLVDSRGGITQSEDQETNDRR